MLGHEGDPKVEQSFGVGFGLMFIALRDLNSGEKLGTASERL